MLKSDVYLRRYWILATFSRFRRIVRWNSHCSSTSSCISLAASCKPPSRFVNQLKYRTINHFLMSQTRICWQRLGSFFLYRRTVVCLQSLVYSRDFFHKKIPDIYPRYIVYSWVIAENWIVKLLPEGNVKFYMFVKQFWSHLFRLLFYLFDNQYYFFFFWNLSSHIAISRLQEKNFSY